MKPSENTLNDFFLRRAGLGHLLGKDRSAVLPSLEATTEAYTRMAELSPRAKAFFRGMSRLGKMGQTDAETFEEITRKVPGTEWEHVATIPSDLWTLLLKQDPDILQDEQRFERFLRSDAAAGIRTPANLRRKKRVAVHLGG